MVDEGEGGVKNDPHVPGWRIKLVMEKMNTRRKLGQREVECELPGDIWKESFPWMFSRFWLLHVCVCVCVCVYVRTHVLIHFSRVQLVVTLWTVAL